MYTVQRVRLGGPNFEATTAMGSKLYWERMVDASQAVNIVFIVQGQLSVPVTLQTVGSETDSPRDRHTHFSIGPSPRTNLPSGAFRKALTLNLQEDWFPYIGIVATLADGLVSSPEAYGSLGRITITALVRELVLGSNSRA